jgi:cation:H+ antiporter
MAVVGAAFLLSWAAEIVQRDIPQSLALIAVLPEYAVDMYLARRRGSGRVWATGAGQHDRREPTADRHRLAHGRVELLAARRGNKQVTGVTIDPDQGIDVSFLGLATLYSFVIKGTLSIVDLVVLVAIFGLYAWRVAKAGCVEPELIGPAWFVSDLPDAPRRLITIAFFAIADVAISLVVEPFAEWLIAAGVTLGLDRQTPVQWLAPLASEAPEFIITSLFVWRLLGPAWARWSPGRSTSGRCWSARSRWCSTSPHPSLENRC